MDRVDLYLFCRYTPQVRMAENEMVRSLAVNPEKDYFVRVAAACVVVLAFSNTVIAQTRAEVVERIRPVGQVAVTGGAPEQAPVAAPESAATPEVEAAQEQPTMETAVPAGRPAESGVETQEAPPPTAEVAASAATAGGANGAALYQAKGCVACHGADGKTTIVPAYPKLAGLPAQYALNQMLDIKSGARNNGQSAIMQGIMANVSDEEAKAIAEWLAGL